MSNFGGFNKWVFDNRFVAELPADPNPENYCRQVTGACYSRVLPSKARKPLLLAYSELMAAQLDLGATDCNSDTFVQVFAGNQLLTGMEPYAMCYGGHQFGNWAGQLGDGRAINLGEVITHKKQRWTLQLKGAGLTPYSRNADGLAVLRSSLREFLCSEAMYHLGVPTTRALSLILTGEQVVRDMFYDGNPQLEPGAVVCRVAPSFIRFGSFQIFAARGEHAILRQLVDYTIRTDFPYLLNHTGNLTKLDYSRWFETVCRNTANLIVHWQRVGFVHGVMNTDNMSILGLTIDYGPYGWLDDYDPNWTPNMTDAGERRYRYGQQAQMALWNLVQLANAIHPLLNDVELLQQSIAVYQQSFNQGWQDMMAKKLGFKCFKPATDDSLCQELLALLAEVETDMTLFYRNLAQAGNPAADYAGDDLPEPLHDAYYRMDTISASYKLRMLAWLSKYRARVEQDNTTQAYRIQRMNQANPKYILRNYWSQQAIDKAVLGDFSLVHDLLQVMQKPYEEQPEYAHFAKKRPDWARNKPGCSRLSCSS